jgi:serine O-acetyltransferase
MKDFQADLSRYYALGVSRREALLNSAVWAIFWYRVGRAIYGAGCPSWIRPPLKLMHAAGALWFDAFLQMRLNVGAQIGPGLMIAHSGGVTLHPDVVIGKNCDLAHQVTIGSAGAGGRGVPKIGDSVYIGTGAVIIGPIYVGDRARIGANSLVNRDVQKETTVMGVPAVVFRRKNEDGPAEAPRSAKVLSLPMKENGGAGGSDGRQSWDVS